MSDNRVLVCGGRDYADKVAVWTTLAAHHASRGFTAVINGGASGADEHARSWALEYCVPTYTFPADWKRLGPKAGPIRNQRMIDEGKPRLVIAFSGGRGTADMARRAKAAGLEIILIPDRPGFEQPR